VEDAASAQNLVLLRSGKTSHSGKVQQGSGVEFTGCGQIGPSLAQRVQKPLAREAQEFRQSSDFPRPAV